MKKYIEPNFSIIELDLEDVILLSMIDRDIDVFDEIPFDETI